MKPEDLFSDDIINYFTDEEKFNSLIHDIRGNRHIFKLLHDVYKYMCENNINFDDNVMKKIYIIETLYVQILQSEEIVNKEASYEELKNSIEKRIIGMKTIKDIDSFYRYYKVILSITTQNFSLEEQYKDLDNDEDTYELNGVSIITPTQTVCRYNFKPNNIYAGSGYHDDNFCDIIHGIYNRKFENNYSGQDIKIRFVNTKYKKTQIRDMTIEIPIPINSSQKISLMNLNESIKKLESTGINISIEVAIINENGYTDYYNTKCENLDNLLKNLVIDDYATNKYREEFFIGSNNLETEFINYKVKK